MKIELAYDRGTLAAEVPDVNVAAILHMHDSPPVADPAAALARSFASPIGGRPLAEIASGKRDACIVISDYTRPVPNKVILPVLIGALNDAGITDDKITILVATGIHTPSEGAVLEEMVGRDIVDRYRIINHFSQQPEELVDIGRTGRGTPVIINRHYHAADLKILTGLIEPHFMAGFSGGRKSICPGVCSLETMRVMHGPAMMEHPNSSNGVLDGNPFHEEALEIADTAGVDFIVNVVIDDKRNVCGIFSGDLREAHAAGVDFCRGHVVDTVDAPVDVVVTSNAGYPLDSNYYQTVKGMVTALDVLKPGGSIVIASGCADGLGSSEFVELLEKIDDLEGFVADILRTGAVATDQWEVEELNKALRKAGAVYLYTTGLDARQKELTRVTCVGSVGEGIERALDRHGSGATVAVIPKGPYVMGRVTSGPERMLPRDDG